MLVTRCSCYASNNNCCQMHECFCFCLFDKLLHILCTLVIIFLLDFEVSMYYLLLFANFTHIYHIFFFQTHYFHENWKYYAYKTTCIHRYFVGIIFLIAATNYDIHIHIHRNAWAPMRFGFILHNQIHTHIHIHKNIWKKNQIRKLVSFSTTIQNILIMLSSSVKLNCFICKNKRLLFFFFKYIWTVDVVDISIIFCKKKWHSLS